LINSIQSQTDKKKRLPAYLNQSRFRLLHCLC